MPTFPILCIRKNKTSGKQRDLITVDPILESFRRKSQLGTEFKEVAVWFDEGGDLLINFRFETWHNEYTVCSNRGLGFCWWLLKHKVATLKQIINGCEGKHLQKAVLEVMQRRYEIYFDRQMRYRKEKLNITKPRDA